MLADCCALVDLLVLTGWVNSWHLVGPIGNLFTTGYGRWLLVKIILFGFAALVAAQHRLKLLPRLNRETCALQNSGSTMHRLQVNVRRELFLGRSRRPRGGVLGTLPSAIR